MTKVTELAYVVFEVSDLAAWEHFATSLLGLQLGERFEGGFGLRTDAKAHRWIITEGPADDLVRSGFAVESNAALDSLVSTLTEAGVRITEADAALCAARKVDRLVLVTDPIGNELELVTGLADAETPFRSDIMLGDFVTGDGGAGHEVLLSKGVPREDYLAFYRDLLGFRVSDTIVEELAPGMVADLIFLHCNPRHHSLAIGDLPHPKKIHHCMLEVSDMRDVGMAHDRCLDAKQPFEMTLGMHPNDRMFSFYVRTPSGFSVEYGWGGLLIDSNTWEVATLDRLHTWGHRPPEVVHALLGQAPFTNQPPGGDPA